MISGAADDHGGWPELFGLGFRGSRAVLVDVFWAPDTSTSPQGTVFGRPQVMLVGEYRMVDDLQDDLVNPPKSTC